MAKPFWKAAELPIESRAGTHGFSRKMSDHIAFALLVYTGLNILLTVGAIKGALQGSVLPYFSLVILVAAIIPGCRWLEKRWERLDRSGLDDWELHRASVRDRVLVWITAIVLPIVLTLVFKAFAVVV